MHAVARVQCSAVGLARPANAQHGPTTAGRRAGAPRFAARRLVVSASEGDAEPAQERFRLPEPDDARGAIALGLKLCEQGNFEQAQELFEKALELPGSGIKRYRDKPRLLSNGEKIAILYNIACCQSRLGAPDNIKNGLIALAGALEAGYDNFRQVRTDPDLEALRADDKFEGLLARFEPRGALAGLLRNL